MVRIQWFLADGRDHPLSAIGLVASAVVLVELLSFSACSERKYAHRLGSMQSARVNAWRDRRPKRNPRVRFSIAGGLDNVRRRIDDEGG
jgi:hypothetical protein